MTDRINLMLLYGGKSGEHEVSLVSVASVLANLDSKHYNIFPVGIDKDGCLFLNDVKELLSHKESLPVKTDHSKPLPSLMVDGKIALGVDIVFPVVHGPLYEDGALQGLLSQANVAYVGCNVLASAMGMDKDISRRLVRANGIQSARYHSISYHSSSSDIDNFCSMVMKEYGFPVFVKPCSLGSSVGTHKVADKNELIHAIKDAFRYDDTVLVEEYICGREIELSVLENENPLLKPKVSVPGEILVHHKDGFYSYVAKYLEPDATELIVPASLELELIQKLQNIAAEIFVALKCKGMARVDFFVNDKTSEVYFNEINTIPGFTPISMYPRMWQASGLSYSELLDKLVNLAIKDYQSRQKLVTHYQ